MPRTQSQPLKELLDQFLDGRNDIAVRDEILYHVLTDRLSRGLRRRYDACSRRIDAAFEDVIQDFFLYLRGPWPDCYLIFDSLKDRTAAVSFLLKTFRNFLCRRAVSSEGINRRPARIDNLPEEPGLGHERFENRIVILSTMIAYCHQTFPPIQCFIFLRTLLTMLDRDRALPDNEMAAGLGLTPVYYRVLNHRVKAAALKVRDMLLRGETICLDPVHESMREELEGDFCSWYRKLSAYYDSTLASLVQAGSIYAIRDHYRTDDGRTLHDDHPESRYHDPGIIANFAILLNCRYVR